MEYRNTLKENITEHLDRRISYLQSRIKIHNKSELDLILTSKKNALQEILGLIQARHFDY